MTGDPAHEAWTAVEVLRAALRRSDVEATQSVRWLAPRPPGERDLLSDMAAAEGLQPAIERLSRFWRRAEVRLERVRSIGQLEAEVYERLSLNGESIPIVSLVRRPTADSPWRVVCTNEAHDERFSIWLSVGEGARPIDDVAWTRAYTERFGGGGELIMDGDTGVLGHPESGWLAHVRGPLVPRTWPEALPGEGGSIVQVATALTPESEDRRAQLGWILEAAYVFLHHYDGAAAYLPAHQKVVLPRSIELAIEDGLEPDQAFRFWARLEETDGHVVTTGLRQLGIPEIEARVDLLGDPRHTANLVRWMGARLVDAASIPSLGTELVLDELTLVLTNGRRGPRRGRSYGRWGSMAIASADPRTRRGSVTRMRVPSSVRE